MRRLLSIFVVIFAMTSIATAAVTSQPASQFAIPPDVQKIMDKMSSGQQTTPAEQKRLQQWGASMYSVPHLGASSSTSGKGSPPGGGKGGAPAIQPVGNTFSLGNEQAQNPCSRKAGTATGFGATPSAGDYVAMAKDALRVYRANLDPGDAARLDKVLTGASNPSYGGSLAAGLVVGGFGSWAIVSAAYAAEKNPNDAVTASNLGVLLRGLHDYKRAAIALQYAKSKAPDSPVVATNLGWLAMSQGDSTKAGKFFAAAVTKNGKFSEALLGQGLIKQCAGQYAQALQLFRASMQQGFTELAAAGIDSAEDDLEQSDPNASIGSDSAYGQEGSSGGMPNWQDPPFPSDVGKYNAMAKQQAPDGPFYKYQSYWVSVLTGQQTGQIKSPSSTSSGSTITFDKGDEKQAFMLGDIRRIITRTMDQTNNRWSKAIENARSQAGCNSCAGTAPDEDQRSQRIEHCFYRPLVTQAHNGLVPEESSDWTQLRKSFADLYGFSQSELSQIDDESTLNYETWAITEQVVAEAGAFSSQLPLWGGEVVIDYNQEKCGAGASSPPPKQQQLKPYKLDPTKCHTPSIAMNFGPMNLNANCEKMTLTMGEGLVGSVNVNFAPDYTQDANGVLHPAQPNWGNDQVTLFVGAGASGEGALTANVAAGGYITVQGGNVIDVGVQGQAGLTIGNGNETPVTGQAGATAQISLIGGPDTPTPSGTPVGPVNVSPSGGPVVGGPCGVSCGSPTSTGSDQ